MNDNVNPNDTWAPRNVADLPWRKCWREGFLPGISTPGLEALASALASDNKELLQGATTSPPPLQCVADWPVESACPVSYTGWKGDALTTVGEVEEYFARTCQACDERLGEAAACRYLLNWIDDTPREEMRTALLEEVNLALAERYQKEKPCCP